MFNIECIIRNVMYQYLPTVPTVDQYTEITLKHNIVKFISNSQTTC